jgi:ribosomal-protein-alanine N-acetyltransferase
MISPGGKIKNPPAVTVRRMSASDVSAVFFILEESPEASIWTRESLLESASRGTVWVAEMGGGVAGILVGRVAADEFEVLNLAVAKAWRRRGIATRLLKAALENARTAGARQAYLDVRASNEGGIALYERLGFQVFGRRQGYYRNPTEDAVQLVLHNYGLNP